MTMKPDELRTPVRDLITLMADAGRPAPQIVPLGGLTLDDPARAREQIAALAELGVTGLVHAGKYTDEAGFAAIVEALGALS